MFFEPEEKGDLLWSSVEQFDFTPIEEKASDLRAVLLELRAVPKSVEPFGTLQFGDHKLPD